MNFDFVTGENREATYPLKQSAVVANWGAQPASHSGYSDPSVGRDSWRAGSRSPHQSTSDPVLRFKLLHVARLVIELGICAFFYCVASLVLLFPERGRTPKSPGELPTVDRAAPRIDRAIPTGLTL